MVQQCPFHVCYLVVYCHGIYEGWIKAPVCDPAWAARRHTLVQWLELRVACLQGLHWCSLSAVLIPPPQLQSNGSPVMPPRCHKEFIPTHTKKYGNNREYFRAARSHPSAEKKRWPKKRKKEKKIWNLYVLSNECPIWLNCPDHMRKHLCDFFFSKGIYMLLFLLMESNCHTHLPCPTESKAHDSFKIKGQRGKPWKVQKP